MKSIYFTALFAVLLLLFSCQNQNSPSDEKMKVSNEPVSATVSTDKMADYKQDAGFFSDSAGVPQQTGNDGKKKQQQLPQEKAPQPDWDKKIVKTASLNAEVTDYKGFSSSLREKVKALGGYIAQEEQNQSEYKIENTLVIKVPVDRFDDAVVQLSANAGKINEKKISSQDVTTEMVDTRSRMEAKKQVRLRYMDLLKQAKNMEEILSVQSEINDIQEQIESAAGRMEYLGHSSVFSTINLTYYQVLDVKAKDTDSPSFGTKLGSAFRMGWSWVRDLSIGLVSIWPLFLLGFLVYVLYKRSKVKAPKQA